MHALPEVSRLRLMYVAVWSLLPSSNVTVAGLPKRHMSCRRVLYSWSADGARYIHDLQKAHFIFMICRRRTLYSWSAQGACYILDLQKAHVIFMSRRRPTLYSSPAEGARYIHVLLEAHVIFMTCRRRTLYSCQVKGTRYIRLIHSRILFQLLVGGWVCGWGVGNGRGAFWLCAWSYVTFYQDICDCLGTCACVFALI